MKGSTVLYQKDKFTVSKANLAIDWSTVELAAPHNPHHSSVKAVWFKKKDGEWQIFGGFIGAIGVKGAANSTDFMQAEQHFLVDLFRWDGANIKALTTNLSVMVDSVRELDPLLTQFKLDQSLSANYDRWYSLKP